MFGWGFIAQFWFYSLLGIVAAAPIAMMIGAAKTISYSQGLSELQKFLTKWTSGWGKGFWKVVLEKIALPGGKIGGAIVLLALLAWLLSELGTVTMPRVSSLLGHLGSERLTWSINHKPEWEELQYEYRNVAKIGGDPVKWHEALERLGAVPYRVFRTLFWFGVLIIAAGVINVVRRSSRRRGIGEIIAGIFASIIFTSMWADVNDRFVRNLVSEYREAYKLESKGKEPVLPKNYPSNRN